MIIRRLYTTSKQCPAHRSGTPQWLRRMRVFRTEMSYNGGNAQQDILFCVVCDTDLGEVAAHQTESPS